MTGGELDKVLVAYDSSTVTISGGNISNSLIAHGSSQNWIIGYDFAVGGVPVPYGDLVALSGTLTGTLASGDSLNNVFYQGGGSHTGTITLIPEPSTALLLASGLAGLAAAGRRRSFY